MILEGDRKIDMMYVCQKDVKKMLVQKARSVCWKKWAAKHWYEEFQKGIWLEPALALLRKKTKEDWTEKHRNVARKWVLEGGRVQQRLFDTGWSDESKCQACHKEKGTEKTQALPLPRMVRSQTGDSTSFQEAGAKSKNFKEGVDVAKRYVESMRLGSGAAGLR